MLTSSAGEVGVIPADPGKEVSMSWKTVITGVVCCIIIGGINIVILGYVLRAHGMWFLVETFIVDGLGLLGGYLLGEEVWER